MATLDQTVESPDSDTQPANSPDASATVATEERSGWRKIAVVTVLALSGLAAAGYFFVGKKPQQDLGPQLTHKVVRGDMEVTVVEQGLLESSENTEIKCRVRGQNTVIFVVESGTIAKKGQELLRLDTLFIEEQINERSKYAHWSRSGAEQSKADVNRSRLAVDEYKEGRFIAELMTLEKDLAIAESQLRTAKNMLDHSERMLERGYVSDLEVEDRRFRVKQAKLDVDVKKTDIDVLKEFTKKIQMESLKGNLASNVARHEADKERAYADAARRDRAVNEYKQCVIKAPRDGLVIHPSAAKWRNAPQVEEGGNVYMDQVLLLMPDLSKMQVKIGVHESVVDRVNVGLKARVRLTDRTLTAEVSDVSEVTRPAGWWTGNVVKYDTIVKVPQAPRLKPGMSAEVEIIIARYNNVLLLPVAAVLETQDGDFCWVKNSSGEPERRTLKLGDTNDIHVIVESGLAEGEDVILNPLAFIEEAQDEVLKPRTKPRSKRSQGKKKAQNKSKKGPSDNAQGKSKKANKQKKSSKQKKKGQPMSKKKSTKQAETGRAKSPTKTRKSKTTDSKAGSKASVKAQQPSTSK